MCGILGYIKLQNGRFDEDFKLDFASMFYYSQTRGKHATGFAMLNPEEDNGQENYHPISYEKAPIAAEEFISKDAWNNLELPNILIGHTRYKTKGDQSNPLNNHPIMGDFSAVVHNGSVHNDDILFKDMQLERKGQVDSEIIIRLLEHYSAEMPVEDAIKAATSKMRGSFACAYITPARPDTLFLFRHDKPLVLGYIKELGIIVFASEKKFIQDAFLTIAKDPDFEFFERVVSRFKIWYKEIKDDTGIVINTEGIQGTFDIEPLKGYTQVQSWTGSGNNYNGRQTQLGFQSQNHGDKVGGSNQGNGASATAGTSGGSEDETKVIGKTEKTADVWWAKQYVRIYTCPACNNMDEVQNLTSNGYYCTGRECGASLLNLTLADLDSETLSREEWDKLKEVAGDGEIHKSKVF